MDKDTFWNIIDCARASVIDPNDQTAMLNATVKVLMRYSTEDIITWHQIKNEYMKIASRYDLWAACAAMKSDRPGDSLLGFRSWLISQGRAVYMQALHEPDSLAGLNVPAGTAAFDKFYEVAYFPYALKKAAESDDNLGVTLRRCCSWMVSHVDGIPSLSVDYMGKPYGYPIYEKYREAFFRACCEATAAPVYHKPHLNGEDLEAILHRCCSWIVSHVDVIPEFSVNFEELSNGNRIRHEYEEALFRACCEATAIEYLVTLPAYYAPLSEKDKAEILSEIHLHPDISPDFQDSDLPGLVPRLLEKYREAETDLERGEDD